MRLTVKLGGSILEDEDVRRSLFAEAAQARSSGHELLIVHGGGKSLSRRLGQLGVPTEFVGGFRVTGPDVLSVALMVLAGEVNKRLVAELSAAGAKCLGMCGADAGAVLCRPAAEYPGYPQNLGFVGKPTGADRDFFEMLLGAGITPVVASIAAGEDGRLYNVNADQMASVCAWSTGSDALVYLTDVPGVLDRDGNVAATLSEQDIAEMRTSGVVTGGMLPKTESCVEALRRGVRSVFIASGRLKGALVASTSGHIAGGTHLHARH